jgi:predicted pyridoxine 5'-phosphate oxidase superfamily flavin-nucleotide-binding protein
LENPQVGLCFQIPGNSTTLRVGGKAALSNDPHLLSVLAARGVDATIAIKVEVTYAFFHCAKAYLRSKLWQPSAWPEEVYEVKFGPYFAALPAEQCKVDENVEEHYNQVQQSVDGELAEPI